MEQNFADLLTDAFSDTSLPSLPEGELDFEPLHFDEYLSNRRLSPLKEEDEEIGQTISRSVGDVLVPHELSLTEDNTSSTEEATDSMEDQERKGGTESNADVSKTTVKNPRVESVVAHIMEEEKTDSGEEIEEDIGTDSLCPPGSWSLVVRSKEAFWDTEQENEGIGVTEGRAPTLEGTEHPQVRNEQQGEILCNDVTYFQRVSAHGRVKMTEHVREVLDNVEKQKEEVEDFSDSSFATEPHQDTEQAISILKPYDALDSDNDEDEKDRISGMVFEVPDLAKPNIDGLVIDGFAQQHTEDKTKGFSEEDLQEAGESLADYPSDLSSCEYVEMAQEKSKNNQVCTFGSTSRNILLDSNITETKLVEDSEEFDQMEDLNLCTGWTRMDVNGLNVTVSEEPEDREQADKVARDVGRGTAEVHVARQLPNSLYHSLTNSSIKTFKWSSEEESDSNKSSEDEDQNKSYEEVRLGSTHQGLWKDKSTGDQLLPRERGENSLHHSVDDQHICETSSFPPPTVTLLPADQCDAEVQQTGRLETDVHASTDENKHGTIDDDFMFDDQYNSWGIIEEEDDEDEERERNWEKERERIDAFYKFYSDEEQEDVTESNTRRVQFCVDSLSEIFQYDADSSSEVDEDPNPCKSCNLEETLIIQKNKNRSLSMHKFMLNMSLVTLTGLAVFWWAKDQLDWLG